MGSVGASKGNGRTVEVNERREEGPVEPKGDVSFADLMKWGNKVDVKITGDKIFTVSYNISSKIGAMATGKKGELSNLLGNAKTAIINFYNDKSGANDLKRMQDLGFEVVAKYTPDNPTNSNIPARHYYYMKRK